jgi:hypothetical protein
VRRQTSTDSEIASSRKRKRDVQYDGWFRYGSARNPWATASYLPLSHSAFRASSPFPRASSSVSSVCLRADLRN